MSLFSELKRRNIFKVAMAYLALGWVVVQITDVVVPALNLPVMLNAVVVYIGIIGFPFALFFTWAFELTPDGVRPTSEVVEGESIRASTGQKINYIIIGLMAIAITFLLFDRSLTPEYIERENTIAVMPFADMSADGDQEYFGDGIAEEILNVLVSIDELNVTSRTSSFAYRDSLLRIPEIAGELGVNYIVEGSIRTAGDSVRVTAQLIDVSNDEHMWSDTFDRELTDIFTIQDQISRAITDALRIELVGGEVLVEAPTDNMDAYGVYLQARQIFLSRGSAGFEAGIGGLKNSIDLYERATELDPTFAEAWADLAAVMMLVPEYGTPGYSGTEHIPIARTAAERAINLKPTLSQAWAVKGFIDLGEYKFLDAETALTHALNLNANNASALLWLGQVNAAVGKHKEAIKFIERAIELSPNTGINYLFLLASLVADGQIEKANAIIEQRKGTSTGIDTQANVLLAIEDKNWQLAKEKAMELARLVISFTDEEQKIEYDQMIELNIRAFYEPEFREQAKAAFIEYDGNLTDFIFLTVQDAELTVEGLKLGRTNKGLGLIFTYLPFKRELFRNKIFRDYLFEIGLFDYWKSNQFPDICRALGEDDFECQDGEGNWPT